MFFLLLCFYDRFLSVLDDGFDVKWISFKNLNYISWYKFCWFGFYYNDNFKVLELD